MFPPLTLAVVGADYANEGKSPPRRFELAICQPGEPVELIHEPKNPADENAIAVLSCRGIQIGYLTAERAPLILKRMREGNEPRAIFQSGARFGAYVRVAFDEEPVLPAQECTCDELDDSGFWPDPEWRDDDL